MPKVELGAYEEDRQDRLGLSITLADGSELRIPTLDMWPPEVFERAADPESPLGPDEQARLLLGEDYDRFIADPHGDVRVLDALIREWMGGSLGESAASSPKSGRTPKK